MARPATKSAAAAAAWRHIFEFIVATAPQRVAIIDRLGLTPAESRALTSLDSSSGRSMRSLAEEWECDPSNATWLVDRLEDQDLARRISLAGDRRVKSVILTAKGRKVRAELLRSMAAPPPELLRMSHGEIEALRVAAAKLPGRKQAPAKAAP
jgi:MarR family transcriptional regulator, organic hydroperoxide resistance regulator